MTVQDAIELKAAPRLVATSPEPEVEKPQISVIVPGLNEADSLTELATRIRDALDGKRTFEIIFVDDGSTDNTWEVVAALRADDERIKGVQLRKNFGKAMALLAGFQRAQGEILITMDADLQDDPSDLMSFIDKLESGTDVVVGWKVERLDPKNRLILSSIFNGTVRRATGVKLHDMNCGFKGYKREVIRTIPLYGDLFRFIPAFAAWDGFRVAEVPVKHAARKYGQSRYGLERILRGFFDLLSVIFLTRYSRKPMHLFGLVGLVLGGIGTITLLYLTVLWFGGARIGNRPLLLLGALEIIAGIQFFSMGFIGEFMTYQNHKKFNFEDLPIREEDLLIPDAYFARFETPKYQNKNPVQRALIRRFISSMHDLFIEANPVTTVLEVGVGEGFLSGYLSEKFPAISFTGVDLRAEDLANLSKKFPRIKTHQGSAYDLSGLDDRYDLIICAEVMEHLDEPERALDEMLKHHPRNLLLSVPHEPFFMLSNLARGKNVSRWGNDPEHINHWSPRTYSKLLSKRLEVQRLTTSYPWILALAAPR